MVPATAPRAADGSALQTLNHPSMPRSPKCLRGAQAKVKTDAEAQFGVRLSPQKGSNLNLVWYILLADSDNRIQPRKQRVQQNGCNSSSKAALRGPGLHAG